MIILEIYIDWQEAFKTVHLLGNDYEIKLLYLYFYLKLNFNQYSTVSSIDSVIESKIIFAHKGAISWIPKTPVCPAPVRVSMHMLSIPLYKHPRAIRTTLSSKRDVLILPSAILIKKC